MNNNFSKKRKKYAVALLAATAATVATSFSPSAPGVMASGNGADVANDIPDSFNPPTYTEVPFDPNAVNLNIPYYHVQAGDNVSVTTNTFVAGDYDGNVNATFNNFIVKANDTLVEDSDDIVVDQGNSEHATQDGTNGVTRKYKLKLSDSLKEELKNAAGGGGGAAPSKLEAGTNTTVEGDGTEDNKYKVNINPELTGITSITGDTLTLHGGATTVAITDNGVDVGGKKITNLEEGDVSEDSTDAVTGKQLDATNKKIEAKLDKTAERHIKPQAYTVNNGTVTLKYVDADGNDITGEEATISGLNPVKSVTSGDANTLTVANNNGDITVTPVVAANITDAGDANKLATAGAVNTAITNATAPLADKNLSNITDAGKKVITGLGTEVVQGDGVTVTSDEDKTTGKKTYTISAAKLNFAAGTNTTVEGDGTKDKPYKYNVNPALTGITSITGDTLTLNGGTTAVTINNNGVDVGGKKITNLKEGDVSENSTDAVTGKQLDATNKKIEAKLDKTAERHIKPQAYTVNNGTVTLKYVDADGNDITGEEATISGLNPVKSVTSGDANTLTVANNNGDITVTPVVAANITDAGDANKLATAGAVNTAITNATSPLADKNLSNITDAGKKVITGLGTAVVQGDGVTVTSAEDATTGKKTYTISAVKPKFAAGTNTTIEGDGTATSPYKYNVNPALTGITSITNATTADGDGTKLTIDGDKLSVVNKKGTDTTTVTIGKDGIDAGNTKITNVATPTDKADAANKEYVDAQKWGLKVQNGDNPAEAVTAKDKAITLKASADASDDEATPKKGLLITKDDQGNITVGLDKATRTALDNAVNGSQLFNERVTSPVIFVDKDGNQVFKTAEGKFVTKDGAEVPAADLDKVHTKVNADKPMTLDNVASAVNNLTGNTYLDKLAEGAKADNKVANSAVNVTDLHNTANALVTKGLDFQGNLGDAIHKDLGAKLDIVGEGTVAADATTAANNIRTKNVDGKLEIGLVKDLKNITSITNAAPVDPAQPDAAKVASTTLTINGDALTVENKQADGTKATVTIGKDGIDAGNKKITNVATPEADKDAANKEYVDAQKWGLKVQNGDNPAEAVTAKDKAITLKASADTSDATDTPKKGIVIAKDDEGNITLGLEKADRTTLDHAANVGNTASDGRDGKAGVGQDGAAVAGSAGAQGPTGKDGLNGKDLTNKVNALRNGEAGTVVYTNAAGDRLVKANDGQYYKADEVEPNGEKKPGATAVPTKDVIASLVSPDGKTTGATTKLSNIADGAISKDSKDAVNGSQLFNERVTSPVIFVDKDGNQVFKTAEGKFVTKDGAEVPAADLDKVHTKVNADKPMTLDNVASAVNNLTGNTYLDKLAEGAKADNKVANSAVNVTDLHAATTAILDKPITFIGDNDTNDKIERKLGETLKIHGDNNITVKKDATHEDTLNVALQPTLTGITSITNAAPVDPAQPDAGKVASTTLTINGDALTVENKQADGTKATVTIGKDGVDAGNKKITNVATPEADKDAANKEYVDAQKWGLKVQNGDNPAEAVTAKDKAITLKASADTSDATDTPKKGIVIAKDDEGNITLGLEKADRTTLDHAANIGNTASDGRDGQAGAGKDGATVAGSAGAQGPTGKDGLNGKDLTSKVNALRNGEAGTVVYTNAAGDRVVKANDGNYYKADEVKPDGNVKTPAENGGTAPVAVTPEARLVSPDGTVTNGTTVLNNISSVVTPLAGTNTLEKLEKAAKDDSPVKNAATNVTDLHNTANAIVEKGLTFKGNAGDEIHKNLGEKLDIVGEGTVAADATTAANNIRTKNVDGKLEIGLVKDLKNITSITNAAPVDPAQPDAAKVASTTLTIDGDALTVENKQADGTKATVTIGKDGIDAGGKKITNVAEPTDNSDVATKKYVDDHAWDLHVDDGTGTGTTVVPKNKVITFKAGTGTIAPTDLPAGQDSPSKDTDGLRPKTGVVVETDKNGTITIGLEETARKTLDNAANVGNTGSDGRDGKAGTGTDGAAVAGTAGAQGPTGKDGLNGKDLTSKVNALRNGEAGTVVYTNAAGDRVVKANDGKYYKADEVKPDGNVKTPDENGGTAPVAVTPEARLVSPDGTVTNGTTVLNNISSVVTPLAGTNTLEKLEKAAKDDSPVKNAATNVTDLHNTANAIVEKGLTFKGNAGDEIHKNLGEKLDIVGEGTVADTVATAANNIRTKNVDGKLEIGIVKDLTGITSITNATTADGAGTKLVIDGDKVSIANKQADGTTKTITIGKDGINADGTKITNLADADLSDKSTDAVTGKQLHATNERVSNLEETKLDKTDDVHVKAGTYTVDDKTGTVALPLVKGDADTATGKNVTISGIVTHAVLSDTLEKQELHIAGDDNSTYTTTLKDGISLKGASNFTPDEAAKKNGINIQAKATDKGIELKLSDTLTNMKGITFAPTTQGGASVSLTSTGLDNGGNTITNVAAGVNDTDAVNVSQLKGIANYATNVDSRVNRLGAQSAAMAGLRHLQYDPLEPTTLMAGVGTYKGQTALALGIAHYKNESLLFHAGASIGSNHDELMANAGVSWKFGSRADETAVKDTYRQGPISASYTLQDKVSALEAQNQMQKDEINELKAQLAEVLQYIKKG